MISTQDRQTALTLIREALLAGAPGFDSLRPKTPVFGLSPGSLPRETGHFCPFSQKTL